jgi:4-hydroxy-tetrahydrodipicolinate reductase
MRLLVLGRGKTGSLVAEVARERGHSVRVLGRDENENAAVLTASLLAEFEAVIDFTTPEAVVKNLAACLAVGARVVAGTTGWHQQLPALTALALSHGACLLYGTNFSIGVQGFFRAAKMLAATLPGYSFRIRETHHAAKKDAPSGTALTLQRLLLQALPGNAVVPIVSLREGDVAGLHVLEAESANDLVTLRHDAYSRRGFAEGAVRAAEWVAGQRPGVWEFSEVADRLAYLS